MRNPSSRPANPSCERSPVHRDALPSRADPVSSSRTAGAWSPSCPRVGFLKRRRNGRHADVDRRTHECHVIHPAHHRQDRPERPRATHLESSPMRNPLWAAFTELPTRRHRGCARRTLAEVAGRHVLRRTAEGDSQGPANSCLMSELAVNDGAATDSSSAAWVGPKVHSRRAFRLDGNR